MKISSFPSFGTAFSMPSLAFRVDTSHFPLLTLFAERQAVPLCAFSCRSRVCERDRKVETNNPVAQKKNRLHSCQPLEPHSALSYSCIRPRVQQSVTAHREPATELGTSRRMRKAQSLLRRNPEPGREADARILPYTKRRVLQPLGEGCHYFWESREGFAGGG